MGELVTTIFSTFTETITGISGGLSEAFQRLLYVYNNGVKTEEFSPLILFVFTVAGIGLAAGILWRMFAMLKGSSHSAG